MAKIKAKFSALKVKIIKLVKGEDVFGLSNNSLVENRWKFETTPKKLLEFKKWLREQIYATLVGKTDEELWKMYIADGYRKGAGRAFDDVRKKTARFTETGDVSDFYKGTREEFMRTSFGSGVQSERLEVLTSRTFDEMENVTSDMSTRITRTLADGLVEGKGADELASDLADEVDFSMKRALTVARTELIRAHSEGQLDGLEKLGVEEVGVMVEWSCAGPPYYSELTPKERRTTTHVCKKCEKLEGVVLKLSEARNLIPLHPNAVFAGSSFVSYGECQELVRAWYSGPSVILTLRRGLNGTTIGPNHPVMTRRGMVPAAQLREGDYVLCDNRKNFSSVGVDRNEVPMVEDVFETVLEVTDDSRVVTSSSDLHGDRVFCKGEVQAVHPANGLLHEWDSFGIEKLRDLDFTRTDAHLEFRPGFSTGYFGGQRVYLTSSTLVRERGQLRAGVSSERNPHSLESEFNRASVDSESFFERAERLSLEIALPNFFQWERIHDVSFGTYEGLAFDATTSTSLYYSDGLVVSNCRCAWIPANVGEEEDDQIRGKGKIDEAFKDAEEENEIDADRPKSILNQLSTNRRGYPSQEVFDRWITQSRFPTSNVFCATGPGGGIDPSCGKDEGGMGGGEKKGFVESIKDKVKAAFGVKPQAAPKNPNRVMIGGKERFLKPKRDTFKQELLGAQLGREIGLNVKEVLPDLHEGKVATDWIEGKTLDTNTNGLSDKETGDLIRSIPREEVENHALYDFIIGNSDPNDGNTIITPKGEMVSHDKEHGLREDPDPTFMGVPHLRYLDETGTGGDGFRFSRESVGRMREGGERVLKRLESMGEGKRAEGVRNRLRVLDRWAEGEDRNLTQYNLRILSQFGG